MINSLLRLVEDKDSDASAGQHCHEPKGMNSQVTDSSCSCTYDKHMVERSFQREIIPRSNVRKTTTTKDPNDPIFVLCQKISTQLRFSCA